MAECQGHNQRHDSHGRQAAPPPREHGDQHAKEEGGRRGQHQDRVLGDKACSQVPEGTRYLRQDGPAWRGGRSGCRRLSLRNGQGDGHDVDGVPSGDGHQQVMRNRLSRARGAGST